MPPKTTTPTPIVPDLLADLCVVSTFLIILASLKTFVRLVHGQYAKHLYFNVWFEYKIKHFCFAGCKLQLLHSNLIHLQCKWRRKSESILRNENVNNSSPAINHCRNSIVLLFKLRLLKSQLALGYGGRCGKRNFQSIFLLVEAPTSRIFPAMGDCRPSAPQVNTISNENILNAL